MHLLYELVEIFNLSILCNSPGGSVPFRQPILAFIILAQIEKLDGTDNEIDSLLGH